jgi:NTE family protein
MPPSARTRRKKINLALQGGGAHGAFTWGVLHHLLADGRLEVEGVSGASAGAVNAVLLADGMERGGVAGAQTCLADFWRAVSRDGSLPDRQREVVDRLFWFLPMAASPVQAWFDLLSHYFSPYDLNPLALNPLRDLIGDFVDFKRLRAGASPQLFISATNVQTGRVRIFPRHKVTADVIAASACLPVLFQAVEIDRVPYWDGGYMGNPVLFPLFRRTETEDLVIVQINPLQRPQVPQSSPEIMARINEISFNSSLIAELRAIEFVGRLIDSGKLPRGMAEGQYRRINVHRIVLDGLDQDGGPGSRLNNDYDFFLELKALGERAAKTFLAENFRHIGKRSTVDLAAEIKAEWA